MKYLIDTNVLVDYLRKKSPINESLFIEGSGVSIITKGELYYGAFKSDNPKKNLEVVDKMTLDLGLLALDVDEKTIVHFSRIKAFLEKEGQRLEDIDILIAATALSNKLILVTHNVRHFKRIKGLEIQKA
ncbi:MAG: type II toxin-antitoxin system VapC family toxin [Candidatus Woesebacteria bacterium]|jgi:tRNA(fMet)-specific endonuclease VapC